MNKKFSTLVASLLVSSTFGVYNVGAVPVLANQTQIETRAVSADVEETVELAAGQVLPTQSFDYLITSSVEGGSLKNKVLAGFTDDSRIAYVGTIGGAYTSQTETSYLLGNITSESHTSINVYSQPNKTDYYWTLRDGVLMNDEGRRLSVEDKSDNYEIVPLKENGAEETSQFFAIARRNAAGEIQYVKREVSGSNVYLAFTAAAGDYKSHIAEAALFVSVETAYTTPFTAEELNKELGENFELAVSSKLDETLSVVNANVFAGMLKAVEETQIGVGKYYRIQNADGEYIVFDTNANITSDGYSLKGQFKTTKTIEDQVSQLSYFQILKADNESEDVLVNVRNSSSTALQGASVAGAGKNKGKGKISGKAAAAAAAAALKAKGIKAKKGDKQDPIHINARDYELKTHSLDSVVKTILHYNLGNHREALTKAINRGRIQGQSKKSQLLDIKEVSRGDVNNFYQYTHNLIMSMPRPHQNLTKRQSQILNFLKSERALWLEVVNHNQQRLNKQLRQAQAAAKIAAEQQYAEQLKSMQDKLAAGEGADSAAAAAAAAATDAGASTAVTAVAATVAAQSKDKSDTREQGGSPCGCKEAMAKAQLPEGRAERERLNGQNANDFYGALSPKELSKQGFSMSKVIDKAIHKKTKPGMAILVSEAILQRGAESVPQLFSTLFCKVKRLAQSELPFD